MGGIMVAGASKNPILLETESKKNTDRSRKLTKVEFKSALISPLAVLSPFLFCCPLPPLTSGSGNACTFVDTSFLIDFRVLNTARLGIRLL